MIWEMDTATADGLCPLCLHAENERLRGLFKSLHWHLVENTVNRSVFLDIVEQALKTKG